MVRVAARNNVNVNGQSGVEGDRFEDVTDHRSGEVTADEVVFKTCGLAGVHEERATRNVDNGLCECLVERAQCVAVARNSALVAECLLDGLAQHDGGVLDCVVDINVSVSRGLNGEVNEGVLSKGGEQVVEEWHGRVNLGHPGAIEVDAQLNCGLTGFAAQRCGTTHGLDLSWELAPSGAWSILPEAAQALLGREHFPHGIEEGCGLGNRSRGNPERARETHVSNQNVALQKGLPDRVVVFQTPEQHKVAV